MRRSVAASWILLLCLAPVALSLSPIASSQEKPAGAAAKPVITVVLPSVEKLNEDMKLAFDLAGDEKGFNTLKETMDVFIVGVDQTKPGGLRLYSSPTGLQYVVSLPVKNEKDFKEFLMNLWDLDLKSANPPAPALLPQVPAAIRAKLPGLKLGKNERLMFNLFDGFLRFEQVNPKEGQVHIGKQLADIRAVKGGMAVSDLKGHDVYATIDGTLETPEARKKSFEKAKSEILGALKKGEKEEETAFALRKSISEHQVAELERFFSESSAINFGWDTDNVQKMAKIAVELTAVPQTTLEQSVELIGQTPDEFAGVTAANAVLQASINFPLDPLRKARVEETSKLAREHLKARIDADEKKPAEQKATDKNLVDLVFDVVDGIGKMGIVNGFARTWKNDDGSLTSIGGVKVPDASAFVAILQKFAERGEAAKVELKVETEGDVELHRLTIPSLAQDYPELFAKDGSIYIGTGAGAFWFGTGEKALDRLKLAIQEVKTAGPKPGPAMDGKVQLLPWIEVLDKVRARRPAAAPKAVVKEDKKDDKKKAGRDKDADDKAERAKGILADLQLRKVALEAFKEGKDTLSMSLTREEKTVKVNMVLDEGIIRFVGKALSKFVKDNLADD